MKICGIDPSLTRTAVCVETSDGELVRCCGSAAVGMEAIDRINRYRKLAVETLKLAAGATMVMLEGYSYGSKGAAVVTLGEYGGILRHMLYDAGCEIIEVSPSTLKKFVTGKGNAKKPEYVGAMTKRWGVVFPGEDEYFAYGLYQMGLVYCRRVAAANGHQKAAVDSLRGK